MAGEALARGLVDELWLYQAPVIMGERARPLAHLAIDTMAERIRLRVQDIDRLGEDLRMILVPATPAAAGPGNWTRSPRCLSARRRCTARRAESVWQRWRWARYWARR